MNTIHTAEEIRTLRDKLGLTQEAFAARLGVAVSTLQKWEAGRHSPLRAMRRRMGAMAYRLAKKEKE